MADSLVPYHFFLIWMLSLLSMATHNATLLSIVGDFRRDWVLRWLRQFLMFVNLALSCVYGVFVLESKAKGLPDTLPISCVWNRPPSTSDSSGIDYVGTIVVIVGNLIVFSLATWYLHRRQQHFYGVIQSVGLALMAAIAIGKLPLPPPERARSRLLEATLTTARKPWRRGSHYHVVPGLWEPEYPYVGSRREGLELRAAPVHAGPDPSPHLRPGDPERRAGGAASGGRGCAAAGGRAASGESAHSELVPTESVLGSRESMRGMADLGRFCASWSL